MTQFAMQGEMDDYTVEYLKKALFEVGEFELKPSDTFNEIGLNWSDVENLTKQRVYESNEGWFWDSPKDVSGVVWGGCLESLDEIMRHGLDLPSLEEFKNVVLIAETSEEIPSSEYVSRVFRAFGERGVLKSVQAVLVGRPKCWEFEKPHEKAVREEHRSHQREVIVEMVRNYNKDIPIVQNMDFGHTDPQIPLPYGMDLRIDGESKRIFSQF